MGANAAAQRYCNWAASSACSNRALQQPTQVKSQAQRPINKRKQWKEPGRLTTAANGCHTTGTMAATTLHTCRTNYALPQCGTQALRQAVLAEEEAQPHPTKNQKSGMHI